MYGILRPLMFWLDPESAHDLSLWALKRGLVPGPGPINDQHLKQTLWGLEFSNPVGVAAGFDKDVEVPLQTLNLGFGFVEVGSITPQAQAGNPRPRLFRLASDEAAINRSGFNSCGSAVAAQHLAELPVERLGPIGVNLGMNKEAVDAGSDYSAGVAALGSFADYIVINVSSPNTPGLRALQGRDHLAVLLEAVRDSIARLDRSLPLLLKVAPDLTEEDKSDIAKVAIDFKLDGLIATNTTIGRPPGLEDPARVELGGLSGRPLMMASTEILADFYRLTEGKLTLIGVGGVTSAEDAYAKIRAGASLVQLYTAMIYQGPHVVININQGLVELLKRDGFSNISDAIGVDHY